jgi:hypothetical protein
MRRERGDGLEDFDCGGARGRRLPGAALGRREREAGRDDEQRRRHLRLPAHGRDQ